MNFLAHIVLSGNDNEIALGNLIADTILPKQRKELSIKMQKGIELHHAIDTFTDQHAAFKNTVLLSRPLLKKYAPVAADVFFDHFLAKHFESYFSPLNLKDFIANFYSYIERNKKQLPNNAQELTKYLIQYDWLNTYLSVEGIHQILCQMSKRTKFESNLQSASLILKENYQEIEKDFNQLFPELMTLSSSML